MPKKTGKFVVVRAYSGVFFGRLLERRGQECDLTECRHIYSWDSQGLPRKALTAEDLALLGAGTGTKISGAATLTLQECKVVVDATEEAIAKLQALPCLA